ncbi:MAG: hypothetical protein AABM33_10490 [Pseudomonadota bacterium]
MRAAASPFFALVLALGLCACAEMRWQKAGGDDAALAQDLAACRKQAQQKFGGAGGLGPPTATDPRFGAPFGPSQADLRMQESQALGMCMRSKGYALVSP